jgi:hypothetical protein
MSEFSSLLSEGDIKVTHRLVDASNATLLGEIKGFGQVIYKPIAGERPLWDFAEGTLAYREVAAFLLSDFLGLHLVPETVLRDGPFGLGAVQKWIDINQEIDLISFAQGQESALRSLALFDVMINNTDRKFGHILPTKAGAVFGCDHGVTFHVEDKLRTVLWQFANQPLTSDEIELLEEALKKEEEIVKLLSDLLSVQELKALFLRIVNLKLEGSFPAPSENWPAVPWPPV